MIGYAIRRRASGRGPQPVRDLGVVVFVTTTASLPVFLVGTLAVEIRHTLHFGTSALGLAVSLYYLGAAGGSVPLSRLTERVGGVRVMRVASVVEAFLLVGIAMFASSWTGLLSLLLPCGIASAAIAPATNLFLARRAPVHRQGLAFGVKQAAVPLASLLGGLAVPAVALTLGWRWAFAIAAALACLASAVVPAPRAAIARRQHGGGGDREGVRTVPLVVLAAGLGLGMFAASGLAAFLVSAAVADGFGKAAAGLVAAGAGAAAVIVRIATGELADRRGGRHFPVVAAMLAAGAVGYALLALGSGTPAHWLLVPASVLALGAGWGWNGLFNFAVVRSHRHAPARATGITQVGGRLGGVLGPLSIGFLVAHSSYTVAWAATAVAAIAGAATMLVGRHLLRGSAVTPAS
jgi:MFS family permease